MKNVVLVTGGIAVAGLFFILFSTYNASETNAGTTSVSAKEASRLISENKGNKNFVVLDIRTAGEFSQGHIKNAVNIDYFSSDFKSQLNQLDKNATYLMHCKSGGRSGKAVDIFSKLNFKNVLHMNGGFNEWLASKLPVTR